jgi:hypothetical protein
VSKFPLAFGAFSLCVLACNGPDVETLSEKTDFTVDLTSEPPTVSPDRPEDLGLSGEELVWDTADTLVDDTLVDDTLVDDTDPADTLVDDTDPADTLVDDTDPADTLLDTDPA